MAKYYEDTDMICGKKYYEVALMRHVKGSVEDDYEICRFVDARNYYEARRIAKACVPYYGQIDCPYYKGMVETDNCDAGLAMAKVVCYTAIEDVTSYSPIFYEYYEADGTIERYDFENSL